MIGLDFETFSDVDLRKHGAARYFESPNFKTLVAATHDTDFGGSKQVYDFVREPGWSFAALSEKLRSGSLIVAQNASFERAVLRKLGIMIHPRRIVDSAVIARAYGAGSSLAAAAPQILGVPKMEEGANLIKVFSVPTEDNKGRPYTWAEINADPELKQKWELFQEYCLLDAELSVRIFAHLSVDHPLRNRELAFEQLTQEMNDAGWPVDLRLVHEMQRRYKENTRELEQAFRARHDPMGVLNLNSHPQLVKWCAERGVRTKSFDQLTVAKLVRKVTLKLQDPAISFAQEVGYSEVLELLRVKQELGGSSLSKLQTIIDMTSTDGRLRNQYLHVGEGQSFRTSGRGVQLQNLARLSPVPGDVDELYDPTVHWDNGFLASNIRQVFEAEDAGGELLVGDLKSVESRGLALLAGEDWKLEAYRRDKDIYKMLAMTYASNQGVSYEDVTKHQRQGGKVGELACGYGAGPVAVQGFAEKMGIDMTEQEATSIVVDWREANPNIVKLWRYLDEALHTAMAGSLGVVRIPDTGGWIDIRAVETPDSLSAQHPGAKSLQLRVCTSSNQVYLERMFHGCYYRGKDLCYYKPSELKGGTLWRARMSAPPHAWYKLYGGKLAGILTQSFCRELFFDCALDLSRRLEGVANAKLIGQFHDELVVEWSPMIGYNDHPIHMVRHSMELAMSQSDMWPTFPLAAEINHHHRYIK